MNPLRLLLWPFAFALSAYRSWRRAEAERERAMPQAVAERLARGVRLAEPTVCYWPRAGNPITACDVWIEPGVHTTDDAAKVTCPRCRVVLAPEVLFAPGSVTVGERGGLN